MEEQEEEFYSDEDIHGMMEADEPDYYSCDCCGNTQLFPSMGNSCDSCGLFNVMQEEYF